jgi:hypothetical protein
MMAWLMMSGVAETDMHCLVSSSVNGQCFNGVHPIVLWHININVSFKIHNILLLNSSVNAVWFGLIDHPHAIIYMI